LKNAPQVGPLRLGTRTYSGPLKYTRGLSRERIDRPRGKNRLFIPVHPYRSVATDLPTERLKMGWIFRGCLVAVFVLGVLLVLMILGAMGVISVPMKGVSVTFCIVAGILFVVPLVSLWLIARFFHKLGKDLGEGLKNLSASASTPAEVHLSPLKAGEWKKPSAVKQAETQLGSLGFSDIGEFKIDEMPSGRLHAMMKQSEGLWAVVYEVAGNILIDIVANYEDGTSTTWSNVKTAALDARPGHDKVREPDADAVRVYELAKESENKKPRKPVSAAGFVPDFEKAYRDEMAWRMARGGPTRDEIRRVAIAGGRNISEEQLNEAERVIREENAEKLLDAFRKNFVESNQVTAAKWEAVRDRVVFVHERMTVDEAMDLLGGNAPVGTTTVREAFASTNLALPPRERYELLGTIEQPAPCDVYVMPEE
jgi:hypothetical protein